MTVRLLPRIVLSCASAWSLHVSSASARCNVPPVELLWSYPAHGEVGVPTNAVFWSLNKYWYARPVLTLDGVPLPAADASVSPSGSSAAVGTPLGELEPEHDYVLRLDFPALAGWKDSDGGMALPIEISFRTGSGPAERLAAVPVGAVEQTPDPPGAALQGLANVQCADELRAQDCFDTGPRTLLRFDVSEPRAVGWLVGGELWPARCGRPSLYVLSHPGQQPAADCTELIALGPGGIATEPARFCDSPAAQDAGAQSSSSESVQDPESARASGSDSCALQVGAGRGASAFGLLVVLGGLLARRRRMMSHR